MAKDAARKEKNRKNQAQPMQKRVIHDERGKFAKGNMANPTGKNGGPELIEAIKLAREKSSSAIETLFNMMQDKDMPANVRFRCAHEILNRGLGRAPQVVRLEDDRKPSVDQQAAIAALEGLSKEELRAFVGLTAKINKAAQQVQQEIIDITPEQA